MKISFIQLLSIALLPVVFISCESLNNPQNAPSSEATLSAIRIVERPNDVSETDDYFIAELEPEFHSDTSLYAVTVDTAFVLGIQPVSTDPKASTIVSLDGEIISTKEWTDSEAFFTCNYEFDAGTRDIIITVTAEDGKTEQVYSIEVTFFTPPSSDATLSDIVTVQRPDGDSDNENYDVIQLTPEFQSETHSYSVTIDTSNVLGIQPVPSSSRASISVALDGDSISASEWSDAEEFFTCSCKSDTDTREIVISVTAEDGTSNASYSISVRYTSDSLELPPDTLDAPSSDATLTGILTKVRQYNGEDSTIVDLQPDFNPEIHSYSLRIAAGNLLGIRPVTSSPEACISFMTNEGHVTPEKRDGSDAFYYWVYGGNYRSIDISVMAGDKKSIMNYKISVSYYTDTLNEPPTDCAILSHLQTFIWHGNSTYNSPWPLTQVFRPDLLSYTVVIDSESILRVQPVPSSPKATARVLLDGVAITSDSAGIFTCAPPSETNNRRIEITVTAEDKKNQLTYIVTVKHKKTYTLNPCYLDEMPMVKWISDTVKMNLRGGSIISYFGLEEVQPSPKFTSDTNEYLVHIGNFNYFGFSPQYGPYFVECSVQGTSEIFYRKYALYDRYYYIKRPTGSKETDTIKIVASDSCETPSVYTIIVAP